MSSDIKELEELRIELAISMNKFKEVEEPAGQNALCWIERTYQTLEKCFRLGRLSGGSYVVESCEDVDATVPSDFTSDEPTSLEVLSHRYLDASRSALSVLEKEAKGEKE